MEPENDTGNVEYKRKLQDNSDKKVENLASQMRFRCDEGEGECIYNIGVEDDGIITGVTYQEYEDTINILNSAAGKNSYIINVLSTTQVTDDKSIYEVLVREHNEHKYIDVKIAISGQVDVGKCLSEDTKIRIYPHGVKNIQDITTEDLLLGDDGLPRRVLSTTSGYGEMYEIIPYTGKSFSVNKNHILCFQARNCNYKYYDVEKGFWCIQFFAYSEKLPKIHIYKTPFGQDSDPKLIQESYSELISNLEIIKHEDIVEISLEQYVFLDNLSQSSLRLYRLFDNIAETNKSLEFTEKDNLSVRTSTSIKNIRILPKQKYYGFELSGNGRFLLEDFMVTHNSSFLGMITSGKNDDGRGSARLSIFNFPHEVKSGRTSSVGHHIIGYDKIGKVINYKGATGKMSWPEIIRSSSKIISFYDLAGHRKYLKTTITGLTSSEPDLCLIMVGANKGIRNSSTQKIHENMTKEHIFLCVTLGIPFAIVVTKIDMITDQNIENVYQETMKDIYQIVKCPGVRRQPIKVENNADVLICAKQVHTESIVPIFCISNVTGQGVDLLHQFFNVMPKISRTSNPNEVKYHVDSTWTVSGVGTVVGGHLMSGTISVNDKLWLGPNNNSYDQIIVRSIHCHKVPLQSVKSGSYVCLGLKKYERSNVRRGNVIVSNKSQQISVNSFIASIKIMRSHSTTIRLGYSSMIHASTIHQSATITEIIDKINIRDPENTNEDNVLRTGDQATVTFKFCYRPEYVVPGMRFICTEGNTKIIGVIKSVIS